MLVVYRRYFRRLRTAEWITPDIMKQRRWIKGVVTSVGDGDNFRLFHTPGIGWGWPLKFRRVPSLNKELKDQTIHVRIAGVDAPEGAHFGRPAQPYAEESLSWLRTHLLGKTVYCQLVRRDQYGRIVSVVVQPPGFLPGFLVSGKSLSLEMLKAGWVTTYEQAGAEYGKWGKVEFQRIETSAKAARRGMWKDGITAETPAEYKRRYGRSMESAEAAEAVQDSTRRKHKRTLFSRWLTRLWPSK
ncbi:hypothetical protein SERLADRAFT_346624 [Serpula lacrymans var. lacrymans S7.9]|uniref:TNase-like domain-containing protein n=1 Tax=Serpula lacrymans var. lacrymans (strain S7.9) TaxID=578457 RepID=F8NLT2_SERL9|nr:uncharacterized protein SERLADRAFT_346624 [Serpula lacrymans var. lacrymans S7.9]EGO28632.1 hypothetical protein SERLADRAFT_346624 [Serpula lacrymans var. lacrymans S7.9]